MHDTTERIRRVELLAKELEHKKENKLLAGLSALCLVLSLFLVSASRSIMGSVHGNAQGAYGAMLLYEDAGGYVLVGVISFMAAVVITILCIRGKKKNEKRKEKLIGEEQN